MTISALVAVLGVCAAPTAPAPTAPPAEPAGAPAPTEPAPAWPAPPAEYGAASREVVLDCIAAGESSSSGGYVSVDPSGYYGRYSFALATWRGAAARAGWAEWSTTRPDEAPPHVQDDAAWQLWTERGYQPWPPAVGRCP